MIVTRVAGGPVATATKEVSQQVNPFKANALLQSHSSKRLSTPVFQSDQPAGPALPLFKTTDRPYSRLSLFDRREHAFDCATTIQQARLRRDYDIIVRYQERISQLEAQELSKQFSPRKRVRLSKKRLRMLKSRLTTIPQLPALPALQPHH
jgi:hypothetical protein